MSDDTEEVTAPKTLTRYALQVDGDVVRQAQHAEIVPEGYIEVSEEEWRKAFDNITAARFRDSVVVLVEVEEIVPPPASISRRQFAQALAEPAYGVITWDEAKGWGGGTALPTMVTDRLALMTDETDRARTEMFLLTAGTYDFTHPKVPQLGLLMGWGDTALRNLWKFAGTL